MSGSRKTLSRPYPNSSEDNTFVQNFASRISSFLPAKITKWFSSTTVNQRFHGNGTVSNTEISDTDDEASSSAPAAKRIKLSTSRDNLNFGPMVTTSVSDLETNKYNKKYTHNSLVETYLSSAEEASPSSEYTRDPLDVSEVTPNKPSHSRVYYRDYIDSHSSAEEGETGHKRATIIRSPDKTYSKPVLIIPSDSRGKSSVGGSTRLQSNESVIKVTEKSPERSDYVRNIKSRASLLGSPFYSGRTTYGGASSSYVNHPNIIQQKPAVVRDTSRCDNTTSSSAQKVRDLLEWMSCPMAEASMIPTVQPDYSRENFLYKLRNGPQTPKYIPYRTQELHAPSIASVLSLKKRSRLMDTTNQARKIIASHSSTSDITPFILSPMTAKSDHEKVSSKFTTKMKTSLTRKRRGEDPEQVVLEEPNIPKVTLQIDKPISDLSFGIALATCTPKTRATIITSPVPKENFTTSKAVIKTDKDTVKFSTPVPVSNAIPACENISPQGYNFGSPDCSIEKLPVSLDDSDIQKSEQDVSNTSKDWHCDKCMVQNKDDMGKCYCCGGNKPLQKTNDIENIKEIKPAEPKGWQCADCWVNNKYDAEKCVCCGGKKPSKEVKTDKCMTCKLYDRQPSSELCALCQKVKISNTLPLPKTQNSKKWECSTCWVNNDMTSSNCVSCGESNPKEQTKPAPTTNHAEKWKCNDCWIQNNANVNQCVACGYSKPSENLSAKVTKMVNNNTKLSNNVNKGNVDEKKDVEKPSFKDIMAAQSLTWECSSCLVANKSDKLKCVCCEQPKPGTEKETGKTPFGFSSASNMNFKFGIDPNAQTVATDNKLSTNTKINEEQSETNNNIVSKVPTFSFGIPTKEPEVEAPKQLVDTKSTSNYTFGVPPSKLPTFGLTNKLVEVKAPNTEQEKPQEVPKVDLLAPKPQTEIKAQEPPKISPNLFTLPTASEATNESKKPPMAVLASVFGLPVDQDKKVEKPVAPITFGIPATTVASEPKGFIFSNTLTKPAATVSETVSSATLPIATPASILTPASTAAPAIAPTIISTTASFTLPAPTTFTFQKSVSATPTLSIFQKPEATTSTPSLFQQKTEPVQTTIAPIIGSTSTPFFSFGQTSAKPNSTSEKPKYNFGFVKTPASDTSSMFSFSATNDTSAKTNSFQLSTANSLGATTNTMPFGGGSVLSNSLTGGTGLTGTSLPTGNSAETGGLTVSSGIFSTTKDSNVWATNNNPPTIFGAPSNTQQKDAPFTFGSTTFGQTQNLFGAPIANPSVGVLFGSSAPAPATQPSLFGSNPEPSAGIFGSPTPAFGAPSSTVPSFEAPSLTQAPTPAFNFGATPSTGMFGFGQQSGTGTQSSGVYAFGGGAGAGAAAAVPSLQFNMGSAPAASVTPRRMRKAARRIPR